MCQYSSKSTSVLIDFFYFFPAGGRSADPRAAGAKSAAGRAEPEEALSHGNPEEEQQTAHSAACHHPVVCTSPCYNQLIANLYLQICGFYPSGSQHAAYFPRRHSSHLEGQAEERQEQPPDGAGCSGARFRVG